MIVLRTRAFQCLMVLMAGFLVSGCLSRSSPDVNYFSLLNMEQMGNTLKIGSLEQEILGIGPINIPDGLERSQIVTRTQNQYEFDEFNRWVGMLENDIGIVLGDNLGQLLGINNIAFFPWIPQFKPTLRVVVLIQRLDGTLEGEAVLSARWAVSDGEGKNVLVAKRSDFRASLEEPSYAALVKAESQLLANLSQEIAEQIMALKD